MNLDLTLLFGSLMSISFALCFAPQIYTMYKNKSSRDVSLGMVILQICGNIGGLGLAVSTNGNGWLYINYGAGLIMALGLLFFWKLFRLNIYHASKNRGPNNPKSIFHTS
tara:strand:- start:107 stop:436 length:330 start_codon:yes stop_codon:yes gene_type:complete